MAQKPEVPQKKPKRCTTTQKLKPTMRSRVKALIYQPNDMLLYYGFVVLRVALVFLPQTGYIHPDEFFQTVEVMAGDEYALDVKQPWEFNTTFPIRSAAVPYIYLRAPLNVIHLVCNYVYFFFGISLHSSYWMLVFPRLVMCAISFVNDFSLYRICRAYSLEYATRLMALGSSYVVLVYGTRTFNNSVEMALVSALLLLVSQCMIHSNTVIYQKEFLEQKYRSARTIVEKVKVYKLKSALPNHSFNKCFLVATICVLGFFNRPTFLVFAFPAIFQWLYRGMGNKTVSFLDFNLRIALFILATLPALIFCIVVDSFYFRFLTIPEIENGDVSINNFVVTPLNFIRYNIDPSKTAQHGEHPKWIHVLVNIPILFNILGVIGIVTIANMAYHFSNSHYTALPRAQSIMWLMTSAIVVPVVALSFINHQEPRFLVPILLPVVFLYAPKLRTGLLKANPFQTEYWLHQKFYEYFLEVSRSSRYLLKVWYLVNFLFVAFFGFIHQGGVTQLAHHFSFVMLTKDVHTHVHLVTSHIYNVPNYLLMLPNTKTLFTNPETGQKYRKSREMFVHEYGSLNMTLLVRNVKLLLDANEMKARSSKKENLFYLAVPGTKVQELQEASQKFSNGIVSLEKIRAFYPHWSSEALPSIEPCPEDLNPGFFGAVGIFRRGVTFLEQFGLMLYRVRIRPRS